MLVAVSAALESLFRWGDVWRDKRGAAELLKIEGWRFFELTGSYRGRTHRDAFPDFADAVVRLVEHEIGDYLAAAVPRMADTSDGRTKPETVQEQVPPRSRRA